MDMTITCIFRSNLRVTNKKTALEFYDSVRGTILLPMDNGMIIRIQPGKLIGFVSKEDIDEGRAWFVPNFQDDDGTIAYRNRKYINAYLRRED